MRKDRNAWWIMGELWYVQSYLTLSTNNITQQITISLFYYINVPLLQKMGGRQKKFIDKLFDFAILEINIKN